MGVAILLIVIKKMMTTRTEIQMIMKRGVKMENKFKTEKKKE